METGLHDGIGILNTDQNVNSLETVVGQQQHLSRNFTPQNNKSTLRNRKLPTFLLSNIQSLGSCQNTDKTTELEAVLMNNYIDVHCTAFLNWKSHFTSSMSFLHFILLNLTQVVKRGLCLSESIYYFYIFLYRDLQ